MGCFNSLSVPDQIFTDVRSVDLVPLMLRSEEQLLQGFSRQFKIFTAVTVLENDVRDVLQNLKNGLYFFFLRFLRTYGTYADNMIGREG